MTPKEEAEQHYQQAVRARKEFDPTRTLTEIKSALDVENKAEYFFERAWAQLQLATFDEAETSLRMVNHLTATRPSDRIEYQEVKALQNELATAKTRMKKLKAALTKASKQNEPAAMLACLTERPIAEMEALILPSIRLKYSNDEVKLGCSKMGGNPDLPSGFAWPTSSSGTALAFLCQLEFNLLTGTQSDSTLLLQFFYDNANQPSGDTKAQQSQWRVLLTDSSKAVSTSPPISCPGVEAFSEKLIHGVFENTFPDPDKLSRVTSLNQAVKELYLDAIEKWYGEEPWHRHGGNSQNVQCEMETDCEELAEEAKDAPQSQDTWKLLLQLDSDENLEMCWGDGGRLYFWIREDDFASRNFDNVRLFMQGY
jgi:uncharacterized protein YwqG